MEEVKEKVAGLTVNTAKPGTKSVYQWEEIRTSMPQPSRRSYHAAAAWGSSMVIFGGQDLREGPQAGVWLLALAGPGAVESWEELPPPPMGPVYRCSGVVHENRLCIFGGTNGERELNQVCVLDLNSREWEVLPPASSGGVS